MKSKRAPFNGSSEVEQRYRGKLSPKPGPTAHAIQPKPRGTNRSLELL